MSRQIVFKDERTGQEIKQFDDKVHHYDKDGRITKVTPYRLEIKNSIPVYIDTKTGKRYHPNGDEIVDSKKN